MQLQRNLRSLRRTYSKCFFLQELLLTSFVSVAADLSPHTVVLLTARSPQAYGIPQSEIIPYGAYFGNHY